VPVRSLDALDRMAALSSPSDIVQSRPAPCVANINSIASCKCHEMCSRACSSRAVRQKSSDMLSNKHTNQRAFHPDTVRLIYEEYSGTSDFEAVAYFEPVSVSMRDAAVRGSVDLVSLVGRSCDSHHTATNNITWNSTIGHGRN
jgi:hypothetical protein